jgi:hypothetical protein
MGPFCRLVGKNNDRFCGLSGTLSDMMTMVIVTKVGKDDVMDVCLLCCFE